MTSKKHSPDSEWWRGGVIYQIYPRSFADSNGDGVGDIPGIIERLPYVASLGVDAIWISPFFKSPMKDFGYDVSDYCDVDPLFGDLAAFDKLVARAHELGLKVMIDQVLSHCSDQHAWFKESRQSRDNPKADWFVWADPQPDGTPPNNWLSVFGGSAWQWESRRKQYFLHNFLASQPDLNFHNPAVQDAMLASIRFWLERGVDGFRFDACNFHFHDRKLRANPPAAARDSKTVSADNPYGLQSHKYDKTQPENLAFLQRVRVLLDQYGAASVGEVGDDDSLKTMAQYTSGGDKLHMAYSFNLLTPDGSAGYIRRQVEELEQRLKKTGRKMGAEGWGCWSIGNHDVQRVLTRWRKEAEPADDLRRAKLLLAMSASLKGSLCIYQGEELALTEADIPFEQLQDPYGIAFWPEFKGRDGCRTPMPWQAKARHGGFSTGKPWLPLPKEHLARAADQQENDAASPLNFYRRFLSWRSRQAVLKVGDIDFVKADEPLLVFTRTHGKETWLCAFNLGAAAVELKLPKALRSARPFEGHGLEGGRIDEQGRLHLAGYGGLFARV
ncbi:alpha-glucosidase family protein [Chitinimonas koreensis]|uniref:alpha-glucosidase family protein n=1 Tax=Chitinimonas koreensis TaxID=356302 RepID=UPI00048E4A89|nr:alpha-glucosidase family protein [Chitinimonas koreensis]QNM98453.1 alpha-glucosidase [Chitinimonas koreensis]